MRVSRASDWDTREEAVTTASAGIVSTVEDRDWGDTLLQRTEVSTRWVPSDLVMHLGFRNSRYPQPARAGDGDVVW